MFAPDVTATSVLRFEPFALGVQLRTRNRQRARRFQHAARVLEDVLDRGAEGVGVDGEDFVEQFAAQPERFLADEFHRRAVGKQARLRSA